MSNRACPTANCINPVPTGPHAVFCCECHFRLPYQVTHEIFALQITCSRTSDDDAKQHLREQIDARIRIAARLLGASNAA